MNSAANDAPRDRRHLRFELIFASAWIAFGLLVLPALIYAVGNALLGQYGEGDGGTLAQFYGDYFGDLAAPTPQAWGLLVGPLLTMYLLRLVFMRRTGARPADPTPEAPSRPSQAVPPAPRRVEPRLGSD